MLKIQVAGKIGADAVVRQVNGQPFTCFKVADNQSYKDKNTGERKQRTTWVSCMKYGENAGLIQYLKKGTTVYVEGEPFTKAYQTQQGELEAGLNCRVSVLELISTASGNSQQQAAPAPSYAAAPAPANCPPQEHPQPQPMQYTAADLQPHDDDLPF